MQIPKFNSLTRELFAKSAFFSEIGDAQTGGRLVFLSAAQRDGDQDDQREQIRQHLEDLIRAVEQAGDQEIQPGEDAEQVRAPDAAQRLPRCEDDQRDGQPAERLDGGAGLPEAIDVFHDVERAAEAGDTGADAGGEILELVDVQAGSVCGRGVFADGAEGQAGARLGQEVPQGYGQHNAEVDHEAVAEQQGTDIQLVRQAVEPLDKRTDIGLHRGARVGRADRADAAEAAADVVADARAEDRQGQAGHVLVRAQADGQEGVEQSGQSRGGKAAEQRDQNAEDRIRAGEGCLELQRTGKARNRADVHDAGNAEVQVAALFRQNLTQRAIENDRAEGNGEGKRG